MSRAFDDELAERRLQPGYYARRRQQEFDREHRTESLRNQRVARMLGEAQATPCQTSGAQFHTKVESKRVSISVDLPFDLDLDEKAASLLEKNLHNAVELVLAPHFVKE